MRNLVYVSPQFPALSLVFEQNEMLGIARSQVNLTILSCRPVSQQEVLDAHDFTQPLLDKVLYPNRGDIIRGIVLCSTQSPLRFLKLVGYTLIASLNILNLKKTIAAFSFALGWYPTLRAKPEIDWIHADFGKGTATVAFFLSELLQRPFSFKVHAFDIYDHRLENVDLLKQIKIKRAGLIFSEHNYGKQKLLESSSDADKIKVNYTAVRPGDFRAIAPNPTSKRFVALGRLVEKKGFAVLIEAAALLKREGQSFTVDIYGSGPEQKALSALIRVNQLEQVVQLKGRYQNEDLPAILTDCIAMVMPSVVDRNGDMDGVPTVIYEAMALGRAVIASDLSGIPEIVQDGQTGYLVTASSVEDLAAKMMLCLADPEKAVAMAKAGRELIEENHDYLQNAQALIHALESV
jgi:colanic acid/amylovoran biosynthesis glycosyltransferase